MQFGRGQLKAANNVTDKASALSAMAKFVVSRYEIGYSIVHSLARAAATSRDRSQMPELRLIQNVVERHSHNSRGTNND